MAGAEMVRSVPVRLILAGVGTLFQSLYLTQNKYSSQPSPNYSQLSQLSPQFPTQSE